MHEHGAKKRYEVASGVGKEAGWDKSPAINKTLPCGKFDQKYQDIYRNQA